MFIYEAESGSYESPLFIMILIRNSVCTLDPLSVLTFVCSLPAFMVVVMVATTNTSVINTCTRVPHMPHSVSAHDTFRYCCRYQKAERVNKQTWPRPQNLHKHRIPARKYHSNGLFQPPLKPTFSFIVFILMNICARLCVDVCIHATHTVIVDAESQPLVPVKCDTPFASRDTNKTERRAKKLASKNHWLSVLCVRLVWTMADCIHC